MVSCEKENGENRMREKKRKENACVIIEEFCSVQICVIIVQQSPIKWQSYSVAL